MSASTFLTRVKIKNYKSIAACDVALGPLNFLVGPNGAGKSNFLDALRFVSDALTTTLDQALRERGGVDGVRRRSAPELTFGIRLEFELPDQLIGYYAFQIEGHSVGFTVRAEECSLRKGKSVEFYAVRGGDVSGTVETLPPVVASDRLYLVAASWIPGFRTVLEALSSMRFYNLSPQQIRDFQPPDPGLVLARDGRNVASVVRRLLEHDPSSLNRIEEYVAAAVPGIRRVRSTSFAGREAVDFLQQLDEDSRPAHFLAAEMSDGTLRALGLLVALFQGNDEASRTVSLVGIEEPEAALHPFALGVLLDALREVSRRTQAIVTSHSPDLLDDPEIAADSLLAAGVVGGSTVVAPVSEADRSVLRDGLFTPGELLRTDQLSADPLVEGAGELRLFETIDG